MSASPRRSSRLSSAAAAPSAAAASSPAAVDDRRAEDSADAASSSGTPIDQHSSTPSSMIDDLSAVTAQWSSPSASLTSAATLCDAAPSSQHEASAIETAAASSSAVATLPSAGSPVRKLYRHALESIFAFASLSELHSLSQVNRDWSAAVMTMALINASVKIRDPAHLNRICAGGLRRHLMALRPAQPRNAEHEHYALSLPELAAASTALPGLHSVRAQLPHFSVWDAHLELMCSALLRFTALRHLDIHVCMVADPPQAASLLPACNHIIGACGRLSAVTMHTLMLGLPSLPANVSFAPLRALTGLRVLQIQWLAPATSPLSDDQITDLCSITSLEQLVLPLYALDPGVLPRLCPPGSTRSWTKLSHVRVTPQIVPCFAALSRLTSLDVAWLAGHEYSCLLQLTQLTELSMRGRSTHPIDADRLTHALKSCTQITSLELVDLPLVSRHLDDLLPCFPRLCSLLLHGLEQLECLRCFATPALSASLTSVNLWTMQPCPSTAVAHLLGLRSLEKLNCAMYDAVSADAKTAFIRGDRFPHLRSAMFYRVRRYTEGILHVVVDDCVLREHDDMSFLADLMQRAHESYA